MPAIWVVITCLPVPAQARRVSVRLSGSPRWAVGLHWAMTSRTESWSSMRSKRKHTHITTDTSRSAPSETPPDQMATTKPKLVQRSALMQFAKSPQNTCEALLDLHYFCAPGHGAYSHVSAEPVLPPNKTITSRCESNVIAGYRRTEKKWV